MALRGCQASIIQVEKPHKAYSTISEFGCWTWYADALIMCWIFNLAAWAQPLPIGTESAENNLRKALMKGLVNIRGCCSFVLLLSFSRSHCEEASEMSKKCIPSKLAWADNTFCVSDSHFRLSSLCWCIWPWHMLVQTWALNTPREWIRGLHRAPFSTKRGRQEGQLFWLKCTNKSKWLDNHFSFLFPQVPP